MLTKKFLALIDNSADGILDLNKAAETLNVSSCRHGAPGALEVVNYMRDFMGSFVASQPAS